MKLIHAIILLMRYGFNKRRQYNIFIFDKNIFFKYWTKQIKVTEKTYLDCNGSLIEMYGFHNTNLCLFLTPNCRSVFCARVSLNIHSFWVFVFLVCKFCCIPLCELLIIAIISSSVMFLKKLLSQREATHINFISHSSLTTEVCINLMTC